MDHHGPLADPHAPLGNGVLVWFEVADFDGAVERAGAAGATVERDVHVNPNAKQRELWLRDPDGYRVVLAGPSEYRARDGA
jgi:predicted enzyme related to lactoylglutathione lyase